MGNINAEFITKETTQAKAAAALGMNRRSVFDIVRREAYKTEGEYIQALAATSAAMETPEYLRAERKAAEDQQRRDEAAIRAEQRKEFQSIRAGIRLTQMQREAIDKQAGEMARRDLAAGKIGASELGRTIEEYAAKLADKLKDSEASSAQFNAFLRDAIHGGNQ